MLNYFSFIAFLNTAAIGSGRIANIQSETLLEKSPNREFFLVRILDTSRSKSHNIQCQIIIITFILIQEIGFTESFSNWKTSH